MFELPKERSCPRIIKVHSKASASDVEAEVTCTAELVKMIADSGHTRRIRNVDSTALDRRKVPAGASVTRGELHIWRQRAASPFLGLMYPGTKLKLVVICHSKNPLALKG